MAARRQCSALPLLSWACYDWANSAFPTLIQTFVFAVYFTRQVAENPAVGSAAWSTMLAVSGFLIAVAGPIFGSVADQHGERKPWILGGTLCAVGATALLWYVQPSPAYALLGLALVGVGTLGVEVASIFYNAMLPDLAPAERVGRWSGWGWSVGYAGGLACLGLALTAFMSPQPWLPLDQASAQPVRATFLLTAGWYLVFALPLWLFTPDAPATGISLTRAVTQGYRQLGESLRHVRRYDAIMRFLLARMLYIDGLATVFAFGGIYAAGTFNLTAQELLRFGIGINVTAGLGAAAFAWVDDRLGSKLTILLSLAGLTGSLGVLLLVQSVSLFWIVGLLMGVFVGPVQAASRSYLARVAPAPLRNEMFGLFAFSGRATSFLGPLLVGWVTLFSGSQRLGMSTILVFLVAGALLMLTVPSAERPQTQ